MPGSANSLAAWSHGNLKGKVTSAQRGMTFISEAPTSSEEAKATAAEILLKLRELRSHLNEECVYPETLKRDA